jgi:hypothetical protein
MCLIIRKESINEAIVTKDKKDIKTIADFVNFAKKHLNINDDIKIVLCI